MPTGLVLASFGWWECFVVEEKNETSNLAVVRQLSMIRFLLPFLIDRQCEQADRYKDVKTEKEANSPT
jgi:hypothetical protein